ncbi:MAG TPA: HEAT repeat domain-containing protein, partial [Luteolibacter sp.]
LLMGVSLIFAGPLVEPGLAKMRYCTILELAEQSDTAFVGKVTVVGNDTADAEVSEVLSGKLAAKSVTITPVLIQHCVGSDINFTVGEEMMIFGKMADDNRVRVSASGQGKITLDPKNRDMMLAAVRRIIEIAPLEESDKNKAMLAEVRSRNQPLSRESRHYIASRISHSKLNHHYQDELISLIAENDPELQLTGLQGIEFVDSRDVIPRMGELTRSGDLRVVAAASMALKRYDTAESTAAIVALTKHDNPQVRIRACIDLDYSRRPEAKAALIRLFDDGDPEVRAMGPRGLVQWLRRNDADDVLPRLVAMLSDGDSRVRASAAEHLGECRNSGLIAPLLDALGKPQDENMKRSILNSLYCHYSKGDPRARELIDNDIRLVAATLRSGGPNDASGASFQAVGILSLSTRAEARESLQWAAKSHPNAEIRSHAEQSLSK